MLPSEALAKRDFLVHLDAKGLNASIMTGVESITMSVKGERHCIVL